MQHCLSGPHLPEASRLLTPAKSSAIRSGEPAHGCSGVTRTIVWRSNPAFSRTALYLDVSSGRFTRQPLYLQFVSCGEQLVPAIRASS